MIGTVALTATQRKQRQRENEVGYGKSRRVDWTILGIDPTFTYQDFLNLIVAQHGMCAVCGGTIDRHACLDHKHADGSVRNVLHSTCNFKVGRVEAGLEPASPEIAAYLQKWSNHEKRSQKIESCHRKA